MAAYSRCLLTLDEFKGIAANAIQQKESTIIRSLDSLKRILFTDGNYKNKLIDDWFLITQSIYHDPDFVSLKEPKLKKSFGEQALTES